MENWRAVTNFVPGSVLVQPMIQPKGQVLASGKSIVGLSLKDGQFPDGIQIGDTVAAYRVGNDAAKAQNTGLGDSGSLISNRLIVKSVTGASNGLGSGDTSVTVVADTADAGALTIAASANEVALVLIPDSKN